MTTSSAETTIRVFYISPGGAEGRGGMGRMAKYLTQAFVASGAPVEVRVLDPYGRGAFLPMLGKFAQTYLTVLYACLAQRVDVVHVHMSFGGSALRKLALVRLASWFNVASVLHIHGSEFEVFAEKLSPYLKGILVRSMTKASRIIVIGSYWERYLVDKLKIDATKVAVVRNGVPLPPALERPSVADRCRIVALGILSQRKGTPDLIRALASLTMSRSAWSAIIAGNGEVDKYRQEAAALGVAANIEMPGWVDAGAARAFLEAADIFVLPSYNEGLPVAILEAMAAGLPVISTSVGAIAEVVIPETTGILIRPGDPDGLAAALTRLIEDPDLRSRLGQAARRHLENGFTINQAAAQLMAIYSLVCGRDQSSSIIATASMPR